MSPDNPLLRYKIRKKIGAGGMAAVFLANDTLLNREVALKMVHPHLLNHPETIRRFSNEAQAIAALSHENIIKIFDCGEARSRPFIVMEYIDGITLETLIAREGTIPNIVTAEIALQVLSGLICAHEKGIYHRDIKPGNILIDATGRLCITDFGIAYLVNAESVTLTGSFLGSPHYISPEQVSNTEVRGTTDIFSLGVVLFQCLTGAVPFNADTPHGVINAILTADPPCPSLNNPQVLLWLADIIESCLIKDPSKRPGSRELRTRLENACRAESIRTGKDRIASFVDNPLTARGAETAEIVTLYREKALAALRQRQIATALRSFEQAALFGVLPASDRKLINRAARQSAIRHGVMTGGIVMLGAGLFILLYLVVFAGKQQAHQLPAAPFRQHRIDPAAEGAAGGDAGGVTESGKTAAQPVPAVSRDSSSAISTAAAKAAADISNERPADKPPSPSAQPEADTNAAPDSSPVSRTGFLKCFTNPPWVTIYIDNIERGTTPTFSTIPLPPGRHVLRLVKPHFNVFDDTVAIVPAETVLVRIRLVPERKDTITP